MRLAFIIILFLTTTSTSSFAQWGKKKSNFEFNHSAGGTIMFAMIGSGDVVSAPAITYFPRLRVISFSKNVNLSIGAPLSLGVYGKYKSSYGIESNAGLAWELPLVIDANFFHGASKAVTSRTGGFAGIGFGANSIRNYGMNYTTGIYEMSEETYGFYFHAGIRFMTLKNISGSVNPYALIGINNNAVVLGMRIMVNIDMSGEKRKY